jgi:hypothetical protein
MENSIDHSTLSLLVQSGAIQRATVLGQQGGWAVMVQFGNRDCPLAAQRSQKIRLFRSLETLANYLKDVGIVQFEVTTTHVDHQVLQKKRPDRALALKRTHEAAAYDTWFREQVQQSLDDPRPSISHDDASLALKRRKADLKVLANHRA